MKWCNGQNIIQVNNLGNAIELNREFPQLNIPTYIMIAEIKPDDNVKLTHEGERFWVKVDVVNIDNNHCEFIGIVVSSDLIYLHPFNTGDCIIFDGTNILNIFSNEWKVKLK